MLSRPRGSPGTAIVPVTASHSSHGTRMSVPDRCPRSGRRREHDGVGRVGPAGVLAQQHGVDRVRGERDDVQQHADIDPESGCRDQRHADGREREPQPGAPGEALVDHRDRRGSGQHRQERRGECGRAGRREEEADVGERVVEGDAGESEQDRARLAKRAQESRSPRGEGHQHEQSDREPADRQHRGRGRLERPARDHVGGRPQQDRQSDCGERKPAVRHG